MIFQTFLLVDGTFLNNIQMRKLLMKDQGKTEIEVSNRHSLIEISASNRAESSIAKLSKFCMNNF